MVNTYGYGLLVETCSCNNKFSIRCDLLEYTLQDKLVGVHLNTYMRRLID